MGLQVPQQYQGNTIALLPSHNNESQVRSSSSSRNKSHGYLMLLLPSIEEENEEGFANAKTQVQSTTQERSQ